MAASTAWAGFGCLFKIGDGATTETFTTCPMNADMPGPAEENTSVDVTSHTSPSRSREWLVTLRDNVAFTIKFFWDPTELTHVSLKTQADNGTRNNYQVVLPGSRGTFSFSAFIQKFDVSFPVAEPAQAMVTVRPTGAMTFA